jgi:hypothetical protein
VKAAGFTQIERRGFGLNRLELILAWNT